MIRDILLAVETSCAHDALEILKPPRFSYHPRAVFGIVWGMAPGVCIWGGRLHPKEKLYAPDELDALCMAVHAYNDCIGTGANLPRSQPRSIVSDKVLGGQGYKSER